MNSRERVRATLNFNKPDRTPRHLWPLAYIYFYQREELESVLKEFPLDIDIPGEGICMCKDADRCKTVGSYTDEWGSIWQVSEPGISGEVKKPVLERWSDLDQFTPPFELIKKRDLDYIDNYCEQSEKFIISPVAARPFERLQWLRGTENALIDIVDNSAELQKLLGIIHEYNLEDIRSWCKTNIDAITLADDWGTNLSLIIDPLIWNSVFKPLYKEYCRIIHNANKYVFFHSDGNIQSIFHDLVEIGVDAINSQLFVMNIEALASQYRGKVTLWGEIDQYYVLSAGTSRDVYNAVMRVRKVFDNGSGGLIAHCSWARGFPVENIKAVFSTWNEPLEIT